MRTECKQVRFEFHQLSQRKVKARFDGGKITSDGPCCMDHPEGCLIIVFFNTGDNLDAT